MDFCGDLGPRFFFTISGFLITWLLLTESERLGSISLKNFYIRRVFRILPVYLTYLGVLFLIQLWTPFRQTPGQWLANLTFTTNFFPVPWPTQHLWSLGVEEQFYLLWPLLLVTMSLGTNLKRAVFVLGTPLVVAPLFRILVFLHLYPQSLSLLFANLSFFRYFDTLAIGCACAIFTKSHGEKIHKFLRQRSRVIPILALSVLFIPAFFNLFSIPGRINQAVTYTLQAGGFALLLMQSVFFPELKGYRWLNWGWIRHLGVLSYSIYIWQQIFASDPHGFGLGKVWWMAFPWWWLVVLVVAHISYYGLERPFVKIREAYRGKNNNTKILPKAELALKFPSTERTD